MSRDRYVEQIAQVPLFSSCSTSELRQVASVSTEVDLPAGRTLMDEGQLGREAFVIIDGRASVRRNGHEIAELGPGSVVGEISLLDPDSRVRTATVEAATDIHALVLTPGEFAALLNEVPSIAVKLLTAMAARVGALDREAFG